MENILQNIKLLVLDIDIWSGRRSLSKSDLKLQEGKEFPPAKLVSLGSKLVMDPEKLAVFQALKTEAIRAVLRVGTRFLGAFAVPTKETTDLMVTLYGIQKKFEEKKREFMDGYNAALNSWIQSNPGWESIILNDAVSPEVAAAKLKFDIQVVEVGPVEGYFGDLERKVNGLGGQLRQEIEVQARATWRQSFMGRTMVSQKAIRPVRAMVAKIKGLAFVEPGLDKLVDGLEEALSSIPAKGLIQGRDFASVCGVLSILGNIPEAEIAAGQEQEKEESEQLVRGMPSEWF